MDFRKIFAAAILIFVGLSPAACWADSLYAWGSDSAGQLDNGNFGAPFSTTSPMPTLFTSGVTAIAGGQDTSYAVVNGAAYDWGNNEQDQVGDGSEGGPIITPVGFSLLSSGVTAVAAGQDQSFALKGGALYGWGSNGNNQNEDVGTGPSGGTATPLELGTMTSGVTAVSAAGYHSMAIKNGAVYSWGQDDGFGTIGNGTTANASTPVELTSLSSGMTAIAAGWYNGLAVNSNGAVFAWGNNSYGGVGDGTNTNRLSPVAVPALTSGVTAVAAGYGQSLALKGGAVYAWGDNEYGQVGNNSTTDVDVPTLVLPASDNIIAVAAGVYQSYALSSDGSLWVWGYDASGQLGLGNTAEEITPMQLLPPAGMRFTGIAPENDSALATVAAVPEPGSFALIVAGGALLLLRRRRRAA